MRISDWSSDVCSSDLLRRDEAVDHVVLGRRLQVLADGEKVDVGRAQVVHHLQHLALALAEADHDAGLGEQRGVEALHRSEEHTSELQSLMRISYAVFCLKKKKEKHK